jgi:hypothetical protein
MKKAYVLENAAYMNPIGFIEYGYVAYSDGGAIQWGASLGDVMAKLGDDYEVYIKEWVQVQRPKRAS